MFITPCVNIVIETLYNACFTPFPPMKPLRENFYGIPKFLLACVNCKCIRYTALISDLDFQHRFERRTHEEVNTKIGALKI